MMSAGFRAKISEYRTQGVPKLRCLFGSPLKNAKDFWHERTNLNHVFESDQAVPATAVACCRALGEQRVGLALAGFERFDLSFKSGAAGF
jgi:hypothetical protein